MTTLTSMALVQTTPSQEAALKALVHTNALVISPDMSEAALASVTADVRLLVHAEIGDTASTQDLSMALEHSPVVASGDGLVTLLTGANEVASYLSSVLSLFLQGDITSSLLIPHAYAIEAEIDSLVARNRTTMRFQAGHVYYCFDVTNCAPETIRKSFGSSIAMYSVAWLFSGTGRDRKPILATIPVFDGDGWAVTGSLSTIFPMLQPQIH